MLPTLQMNHWIFIFISGSRAFEIQIHVSQTLKATILAGPHISLSQEADDREQCFSDRVVCFFDSLILVF